MMRKTLKALILWSKLKSLTSEEDICITYGTEFLQIVQRLVSITHSEEDTFMILVGIISAFPRPFAIKESVLLDEKVDSVMRYEMNAFKALVANNLPNLSQKLKDIGMPIEMLVYKSVASFYANYFSSEIVTRLWDIIIYNFSKV
jgi:hypothetical protein